jgi:hypothetical protein
MSATPSRNSISISRVQDEDLPEPEAASCDDEEEVEEALAENPFDEELPIDEHLEEVPAEGEEEGEGKEFIIDRDKLAKLARLVRFNLDDDEDVEGPLKPEKFDEREERRVPGKVKASQKEKRPIPKLDDDEDGLDDEED